MVWFPWKKYRLLSDRELALIKEVFRQLEQKLQQRRQQAD